MLGCNLMKSRVDKIQEEYLAVAQMGTLTTLTMKATNPLYTALEIQSPEDFPLINVPPNPLLPQEYSETIDYRSLQFLNGYLRTHIGDYMRVDYLIGHSIRSDYGILLGVGLNYILLKDIESGIVTAADFYSIKSATVIVVT